MSNGSVPNGPHGPPGASGIPAAATHYVYALDGATAELHRVPFVDEDKARAYHALALRDGGCTEAEVVPAGAAAPVWYALWLTARETRLVHELAQVAERAFTEACDRPRPEMWAAVVRAVIAHPAAARARAVEEEMLRG